VGGLEKTMQHPRTRAERRHARETWRNHRRKIIVTRYTYLKRRSNKKSRLAQRRQTIHRLRKSLCTQHD
jgi:hypothetical protein